MAIYELKKVKNEVRELVNRLLDLNKEGSLTKELIADTIKLYSKKRNGMISRSEVVMSYRMMMKDKELEVDRFFLEKIQVKPTRTQSGVVPVTVLTKPFECPGQCIFCPTDLRMPKSYLRDEPGAQRAENNLFDPYLQVYNRIKAFENMGHTTDKIELLVLGGTWSFYPKDYQVWFIRRCFDAMNDVLDKDNVSMVDISPNDIDPTLSQNTKTSIRGLPYISERSNERVEEEYILLEKAQKKNVNSTHRNVGLVLETRPDWITEKEVIHLRKLGATKIQLGVQSLDEEILKKNKRGHGVKEVERAIKLLRLAGFKIHIHWMPNLYGATLKSDAKDFLKLWKKGIQPDEIKIYPCSIIETAELYKEYVKGKYIPYTTGELITLLSKSIVSVPRYCRISRLIRDIPSTDIVAGNKNTNLREVIEKKVIDEGGKLNDIRAREIKIRDVKVNELKLNKLIYSTGYSKEIFLSFDTKKEDKIAGFLRLTLPTKKHSQKSFCDELNECAIIREVHVYGRANEIGKLTLKSSQHLGLGSRLLLEAEKIAIKEGFKYISVISAIGTRGYYQKRGYELGKLYMKKDLV